MAELRPCSVSCGWIVLRGFSRCLFSCPLNRWQVMVIDCLSRVGGWTSESVAGACWFRSTRCDGKLHCIHTIYPESA